MSLYFSKKFLANKCLNECGYTTDSFIPYLFANAFNWCAIPHVVMRILFLLQNIKPLCLLIEFSQLMQSSFSLSAI